MQTFSRRHVMGTGLAALGCALVPSLAGPADAVLAAGPAAQPKPRFPGDPGRGRLYYGAAVEWSLSVDELEKELRGHLTVDRSYFQPNQVDALVARVRKDQAAHKLPITSTKVPGTWQAVANGQYDAWLTGLLRGLHKTKRPVLLSLHHEPEDNAGPPGMSPHDWVAMHSHAISLARTLAPNTTITPILMSWTFDPTGPRKPRDWIVPDAKVFGVDDYNDWSPTDGRKWVSFASRLENVLPYAGSKPLVVPEFGCQTDHDMPGRGAQWMLDAFNYALAHNVVAMAYYDSSLNCPHGSYVLDQERTVAMRKNLHRPQVVSLP